MIIRKLVVVGVISLSLCGSGVGQTPDTLIWFNPGAPDLFGPDGSFLPGTPDDPTVGALVQLLRTGGVISDPEWNMGPNFEDTDGATGTDVAIFFSYVGKGAVGDGSVSDTETFPNLVITGSTSVFVRVWDRPSSDGLGNLPVPIDYSTNAAVVAAYALMFPEILTTAGAFYWNGHVQLANADPIGGPFYQYQIAGIDSDDWIFLAIPEPSTYLMIVLGMGLLGYRRFRSRLLNR